MDFRVVSFIDIDVLDGHRSRWVVKWNLKLTIIGSDNVLSPARCQAIIWKNARILVIGPLGTNFSEILIGIQTFSFTKMRLKMSSTKWRPFCLGPNLLRNRKVDGWCHSWKSFTVVIHDNPYIILYKMFSLVALLVLLFVSFPVAPIPVEVICANTISYI